MISVYIYHSQVLKEQSKSSKLKGDLMNMEAVLEWESYFGQVNWSPHYDHYQKIFVFHVDISGKLLQESAKLRSSS